MHGLLQQFRPKLVAPVDSLVPFSARVFDERRLAFAKVRNSRVLLYWPHGFGDFVHLGYILPLLEPSNSYWIARYGDDFSALYKDHPTFPMIPSGVLETRNGFGSSIRDFHLGIRSGDVQGRYTRIVILPELADAMQRLAIDTILWTDYPDPNGKMAFPFQTKIRSLARSLVMPERLAEFDLNTPLQHAAIHVEDTEAAAFVEQRLRIVFGERELSHICLILSGGHTSPHKNWGEEHVRDFTDMYLRDAPDQRIIVLLNDPPWADDCQNPAINTWGRLFPMHYPPSQQPAQPIEYARLIRAVIQRSALMVGVPAGPLHLSLAMGTIPTIGIWRAHHPIAYEEPHPLAHHLIAYSLKRANPSQWRLRDRIRHDFRDCISYVETEDVPAKIVYTFATKMCTISQR